MIHTLVIGCDNDSSSEPSTGQNGDATAALDLGAEFDLGAAPDAANEVDSHTGDTAPEPTRDDATLNSDAGQAVDDMAMVDGGTPAPEGSQITVRNTPDMCDRVALLAPSLPSEAGHYVASVLTPPVYPFAIETIEYSLVSNDDVATCDGSLAHQVLLFALDADSPMPATPSATGLGYRPYNVPDAQNSQAGRQVSITVPIPLILTEGQRAAVAIQFATQGDQHICVATCEVDDAARGIDWWSNAESSPFRWQDLVGDFGLTGQVMTELIGTPVQ
ncbi:MAG: hypothetical protein CMH52_14180 [Myxococcales bacterium]|nr:hypothetical protein [Myxococcales bacterium]